MEGTDFTPDIEVDFETKVIELKTKSGIELWKIEFRNNVGIGVGNVKVDLSAMKFEIEGCMSNGDITPDSPPLYGADDINLWTISRTLEPSRISMNVNGLEVFNILPSADTCTGEQWEIFWGSAVTATEFNFKLADGGLVGYRIIDMPGNYKRAESLYTGTRAFLLAYRWF